MPYALNLTRRWSFIWLCTPLRCADGWPPPTVAGAQGAWDGGGGTRVDWLGGGIAVSLPVATVLSLPPQLNQPIPFLLRAVLHGLGVAQQCFGMIKQLIPGMRVPVVVNEPADFPRAIVPDWMKAKSHHLLDQSLHGRLHCWSRVYQPEAARRVMASFKEAESRTTVVPRGVTNRVRPMLRADCGWHSSPLILTPPLTATKERRAGLTGHLLSPPAR